MKPITNVNEAHRAIKRGDVTALQEALNMKVIHVEQGYSQTSSTLLMLTALSGNTAIGKLLIEHGADVNARDKFGSTALEDAILTGHTGFVSLLLEHGADLEKNRWGGSIESYVDWAERYSAITSEQATNIRALVIEAKTQRMSKI